MAIKDNIKLKLKYEKYILDNGLQVILHKDSSNPVVAVAILYHVGSAREAVGKTGFAHFFEHTMFQRSENLGRNEFFNKINDLGGTFNGGTWEDGTIYYESVPSDSLEKILWMESDRMGFFINTVSQKGLEREIDVVINEKREVEDNTPYGHTNYVINKTLYPKDHPYSHTIIGDTTDLKKSKIEDVKDFYHKYYKPNNATLVISGDIKIDKTLKLVHKYFNEIKPNKNLKPQKVKDFNINKNKKVVYEDKLINMPELNIVFKGVESYNKDLYALNILCDLLCNNKKSPIYQNIVVNNKFAPKVDMYCNPRELAGEITLKIRAFQDVSLNDIFNNVIKCIKDFDKTEIDPKDLESHKNIAATLFYNNLTSNLYKALAIAESNVFGGSPDMLAKELEMILKVTKEDVIYVYNKYLKKAHYIVTSFVPKGKLNLAVENSVTIEVPEESLEEQTLQSESGEIIDDPYKFTKSTFDRSIEPKLSKLSSIKMPEIWRDSKFNGINILGISDRRLPLVYFAFIIKAGSLLDPENKSGTSYFTAKLLQESTANKNSEELEDAINSLGGTLEADVKKEWTIFKGSCLNKNFSKFIKIVEEIITCPRWDEDDFLKIKEEIKSKIIQDSADPQRIAIDTLFKAIYTEDNPISRNIIGTLEDLENITLNDIKDYYESYYSPTICDFAIVGSITQNKVVSLLDDINYSWKPINVEFPVKAYTSLEEDNKFTFVNYEGLQQSIIFIGNDSINGLDPDYIKAHLVNYKLGDSSASLLFNILRLKHGYTYGAYSSFIPNKSFGIFAAYSSVQASATEDSLAIFKDILSNYKKNYTKEFLDISKNAMLRKYSKKHETLEQRLNMLIKISLYNFKDDYIIDEIQTISKLSHKEALEIIDKYINFDDMKVVVVGDKKALGNSAKLFEDN